MASRLVFREVGREVKTCLGKNYTKFKLLARVSCGNVIEAIEICLRLYRSG